MKKKQLQKPQKLAYSNSQEQRSFLLAEIAKIRQQNSRIDKKVYQQQAKIQKAYQSNQRNEKRILRYKTRAEEMHKFRDNPERFINASGYMTQAVQQFIMGHNYQLHANPNEYPNPDNMTYQQLLDLGQQIGKVSKGLSKQQIQKLKRIKIKQNGDKCPICQYQLTAQENEEIVELRCLHHYHQQCILEWLKQENSCPLCKQNLVNQ